jgi:hypothetical protein
MIRGSEDQRPILLEPNSSISGGVIMKGLNMHMPNSKKEWKAVIATGSEHDPASQWINKDLAPTPQEARTWSW